jgi:hypothetical protein
MKRVLVILIILVPTMNSWAWWNESTHRILAEKAASLYFESVDIDYLNKDLRLQGVTKKTTLWLQDGADFEDKGIKIPLTPFEYPARSLKHFHDPTKTLAKAGLHDAFSGMSALLWSQNPEEQRKNTGGDWTWQKVREYQYASLTFQEPGNRDAFEAGMLKGLGYQMHLVQDMSQPNHVRNDTHVLDGMGKKAFYNNFETWAMKKDKDDILAILSTSRAQEILNSVVTVDLTAAFPSADIKAPVVRLYDNRTTDTARTITPSKSFGQGLAEYTNANYFSEDTIFAAEAYAPDNPRHYFAHPAKSETNLQEYIDGTLKTTPYNNVEGIDYGPSVTNFVITKTNTSGESLNCLVQPSATTKKYFNEYGEGYAFYDSFILDDNCLEEQAGYLLPRAVTYSKALLDYFFRGKLSITPAPDGISFRSIRATLQNNTPGDIMGVGEVKMVIRFKELPEWHLGNNKYLLEYPPDDDKYTYKVSLPQPVDLTNPQEITFDFSSDTLPYFFSDMTMQLVFKGKLGNEEGAVAVSPMVPIDAIQTDFTVSLPSAGVYAKTSNNSLSATFNELKVKVQTDIPGGLTGGSFALALEYRETGGDPFQSLPVDTEPANEAAYVFRVAEKNGVNTLQPGTPVELVFDLSQVPLSVRSTDVYLNIIYTDTGTGKPRAIGLGDISEPTPIDIFNNTDYACISNKWYPAGSPAALAAADQAGNNNGFYDDTDTYHHNLTNIYAIVSSTTSPVRTSSSTFDFFEPGPISPNTLKRMGFVLTDYSFNYSFLPTWMHVDQPQDGWTRTEPATLDTGTAVRNQTDSDGNYSYPAMYNMRGKPMWWGAGVVFDNRRLPANSNCSWSALQ